MRVALVHDWLTGMRGGERVLDALCALLPDADVHTLDFHDGVVDATGEVVAAGTDAHDAQVLDAVVALDDFVRETHDRPLDVGGVHDACLDLAHASS